MLPVQRHSKARKRKRRSHLAIKAMQLAACPQCGQARRPQTACGNCGYVNSHTSIDVGGRES